MSSESLESLKSDLLKLEAEFKTKFGDISNWPDEEFAKHYEMIVKIKQAKQELVSTPIIQPSKIKPKPRPKFNIKQLLPILSEIRNRLRISDIGIGRRTGIIYLLGSSKRLISALHGNFRQIVFTSVYKDTHNVYDETWAGLENAILDLINKKLNTDIHADVIPIPTPGSPQESWVSAKLKKIIKPTRIKPVNLCNIFKKEQMGNPTHSVLIKLNKSDMPPIFMSHGVGVHDFKLIKKCDGLIWPSLALTWKIPPSYGDIVFIADSELLLSSVRHPSGGYASKDVIVFSTDMWSPAGLELNKYEKAITHELRGNREWWSSDPPRPEEGGLGRRDLIDTLLSDRLHSEEIQVGGRTGSKIGAERYKNMTSIWRRMKYLINHHSKFSGVYGYETPKELSARTADEINLYSYLEVKVVAKLDIASFPVCLYPKKLERITFKFLNDTGFRGFAVPFNYTGPNQTEASEEDRARWATSATSALLAWSKEPCKIGAIFGETLKGPSSMPYKAERGYIRRLNGAGESFERGYGWCQ